MEKRTIGKALSFRGIGVHSGKAVDLVLKPSESGQIVFRRTDMGGLEIVLDPRATGARNCSYLVSGDCRIQTVEHLLASLSCFGVDSLLIEVNGGEVPILDGSALPFAEALAGAGSRPIGPGKRILKVRKRFALKAGGTSLEVLPDRGFRVSYFIDFDHPAVGKQEIDIKVTQRTFRSGIAPARTFGFLKDVPELRRRGLALGGSLENALILDDEKVLNGPLRFPDEFVRHKVLDLVGDLYLLGCPVLGRFVARKAGHGLHLEAVKFLVDRPEYGEYQE